jgi:hypothetical protein
VAFQSSYTDGLGDLAAYHPSDGSVWVGWNTASAFSFRRFATVGPASGWSFVAGDFTGDGLGDLAAYHPSDGSVWVGRNDGASFTFRRYSTVGPAAGWRFVAGRFAGNSLADVAAYHPSNGSVWIGRNTGAAFIFTRYATVNPAAGWSVMSGDFTGDRIADLAVYHPSNGSVWVAQTRNEQQPLDISFLEIKCTKRGEDGQCDQAVCQRERDSSSPTGFESASCGEFATRCEAHGHESGGDGRDYATCTRRQ